MWAQPPSIKILWTPLVKLVNCLCHHDDVYSSLAKWWYNLKVELCFERRTWRDLLPDFRSRFIFNFSNFHFIAWTFCPLRDGFRHFKGNSWAKKKSCAMCLDRFQAAARPGLEPATRHGVNRSLCERVGRRGMRGGPGGRASGKLRVLKDSFESLLRLFNTSPWSSATKKRPAVRSPSRSPCVPVSRCPSFLSCPSAQWTTAKCPEWRSFAR